MAVFFSRGSIERFLQVFIKENSETVPQHLFYEDYGLGRGTVTTTAGILEELGVIERVKCHSKRKHADVLCYRLTDKGKFIVDSLRRVYEVLGLPI